jgi:hypothetical protein
METAVKRHPLSWIMEKAEHVVDLGIVLAIVGVFAVILASVWMSKPSSPSYFNRLDIPQ